MESKKPWQSKTIIFNAIVALVAIFSDSASSWLGENQELMLLGISTVGNFILRFFTDRKIELKK